MAVISRVYRNGAVTDEDVPTEQVGALLDDPEAMVWLDMEDPSESDLRMLQEELRLHPLAVEDTLHRDQRSKVEAYEGHFFLVIHALRYDGNEFLDSEIHVFVGRGFLVTLRYTPLFDMTPVLRRWDKESGLAKEGGGGLLYTLLDEVVDDYFLVVEQLEDRSEDIETAVFADRPVPDLQERIFDLKKRILLFRRRVLPLREVLDLVGEEAGLVTDRLRPYYRDVADHVLRVLEFIDNVRELGSVALEAHLSQVSNRLNQVAKQVTSWAAIILVPTLIAGIYGMNFVRPFPDFDNPAGFWIAIGMMVVSGGILYWVFRRRGWI